MCCYLVKIIIIFYIYNTAQVKLMNTFNKFLYLFQITTVELSFYFLVFMALLKSLNRPAIRGYTACISFSRLLYHSRVCCQNYILKKPLSTQLCKVSVSASSGKYFCQLATCVFAWSGIF